MSLPFLSSGAKKRDQVVAIDLGSHTTKAVAVHRRGDTYTLQNFTVAEAPAYDKGPLAETLTSHFRSIHQALGAKTRQVVVALGVRDSVLRQAELPQAPVSALRAMLKFNSKNYLQEDLSNHLFDCSIQPPRPGSKPEAAKGPAKSRVLVGAARTQVVNDVQAAARAAGLLPDEITLSLIGPANAFELAVPDAFQKEVVALLEIGFRNSAISILSNGQLILNRVIGIGGDTMTSGLAEAMGISHAEAEGIKIGMPQEVEPTLQNLITPLARELRASIDFFEHQQDKAVSQVYVSGAAARSASIVEALGRELALPCQTWNPAGFMSLSLPPQQMGELEQTAPQLAVAIGSATAVL